MLSEYEECKAFWDWAQYMPDIREMLIKVCNEGKRSFVTGRRLKAIGLRAGVPDYILPISVQKYGSLWIEMKREKDYKIDAKQLLYLERLEQYGQCARVAFGCMDAIQIVEDYLSNRL